MKLFLFVCAFYTLGFNIQTCLCNKYLLLMSSILSVLSPSKSSPNGQPLLFSPPPFRRELSHNAKTPTLTLTDQVDPDDLFTKYTVAEVRFIQNRLRYFSLACATKNSNIHCRADADAKQEELRIMVGCVFLFHALFTIRRYFESAENATEIFSKLPLQ